ncbi:amino acid ABC transporter permease [Bifidobacterium aesculapii]|uniref:amino acid ABC transporter permease n=1 Tax=Bifidobacterium aesculapii TaxID=1329411 RepID=UPI0022A97C68|nr:amino acid ABC transporter permease [Bifidobacterium aesculapii]
MRSCPSCEGRRSCASCCSPTTASPSCSSSSTSSSAPPCRWTPYRPWRSIVALSLNSGSYMSETLRSCMTSVDVGQVEAAESINMTRLQTMRYVILPQAFATAVAPLGNTVINLLKETSLVFNITVVEMMTEAQIIGSTSYRFFEVYIIVTVIYYILCWFLERGVAIVERHFRRYERGGAR